MERKGIIAAGNMLVDHVHQIGQWPERGWLVEIVHSERATGGAPLPDEWANIHWMTKNIATVETVARDAATESNPKEE